MKTNKVKDGNYITIQSFMRNDLELKGNELLLYAIIYGFSQDGEQKFNGSLQYLSDWTGTSKQGVMNNLKSLVEKGFIKKIDKSINGVKFCEYYATNFRGVCKKVVYPIQKSCMGGMQKSLPNNNNINNNNNNINNNKEVSKKDSFDDLIINYSKDLKIQDLLKEWLKVRKSKRAALTNKSIELNLKKLDKLSKESNMSIEEYLEEVIIRGWASFYKINDYSKQSQQQTRKEPIPEWLKKQKEEAESTNVEVFDYDWINDSDGEEDFEQQVKELKDKLNNL